MELRPHTFLGLTQSLCPECLEVVPAKIVVRDNRVYFLKKCPTHGAREDCVCSDAVHFARLEYAVPGKVPPVFGTEAKEGCPKDCGLCEEHEQHTCIGLIEITSSCNLRCPMCYAGSGPGGTHLSYEDVCCAIDRLVEVEGGAEVVQLSGGEPTIHPDFERILDYACAQRIDLVMINSNGVRFATDPALVEAVAKHKKRLEIYLQFDSFEDAAQEALRGATLVDTKLEAVEALGRAGVRVILVCTLQPGLNDHEMGKIVEYGAARPWVTGVSFQPATYSGRHVLPEVLEKRITFPDVVRGIAAQSHGMFRESDFIPLPCAHPNCHTLTYAYRTGGQVLPLTRFIDPRAHIDLLANGITYTRPRARQLVEEYLTKIGCVDAEGKCDSVETFLAQQAKAGNTLDLAGPAAEFFRRALAEELGPEQVFRITITSFLDAYNFDVRRVMKCCIHHVLPSGHVIPFCAYNVLYRDGHLPLPALARPPAHAASKHAASAQNATHDGTLVPLRVRAAAPDAEE